MTNISKKTLLSIQEVSKMTSIGRTSLYNAINTGQLIAKKFGRKTLITADSLEQFINELPTIAGKEGR